MTPQTHERTLVLSGVVFRVVKSEMLVVVIAGTGESLLWADHLNECIYLQPEASVEECESDVGYVFMMNSDTCEGNTNTGRASSYSIPPGPDPEPRFVATHNSRGDQHAFNIYRGWSFRNPHRARNQYCLPPDVEERMATYSGEEERMTLPFLPCVRHTC